MIWRHSEEMGTALVDHDSWLRENEIADSKRDTSCIPASPTENVIGRAVRLSWSRADRDFTGSVGPGLGDRDFTSIPGRVRSKAYTMSVEPV